MEYRQLTHPYGANRVREPEGALPQAARRLDASGPLHADEVAIEVERLNIDSASFHQIVEEVGRREDAVARRIREIVDDRGKMENPVTGSGGMLSGTVGAVGPSYDGPVEVVVGDDVATLVSLTLTPLSLSQIRGVDFDSHHVAVDGRAYLPSSAPLAPMPADFDPQLALAIFDVCGAPTRLPELVDDVSSALILGAGRSGMLCAAAAREATPGSIELYGLDRDPSNLEMLSREGVLDDYRTGDATDPMGTLEQVQVMMPGDERPELVVNTCNVEQSEMASILTCRPGGTVYFFNMATDFNRAALGAEGVGQDVELVIGNGYAEGHATFALELVRQYPVLRERIERHVASSA